MEFSLITFVKPVIGPIIKGAVSLQNFFFARPRLDIDLVYDPEGYLGQRVIKNSGNLGVSAKQDPNTIDLEGSIPVSLLKYDLEFCWDYIIVIKNNSSKTAFGVKIEKIFKSNRDYLGSISSLLTLKEGEQVQVPYKLRYYASVNGKEADKIRQPFPYHLNKIEIIASYTNEARLNFYTRFTASSMDHKANEHLVRKPKEIS